MYSVPLNTFAKENLCPPFLGIIFYVEGPIFANTITAFGAFALQMYVSNRLYGIKSYVGIILGQLNLIL